VRKRYVLYFEGEKYMSDELKKQFLEDPNKVYGKLDKQIAPP
jgi:hypothetical protein